MNLHQKEQDINQLITDGRHESAIKLLFEVIVAYAKAKDFAKAEELRDKLIYIYPKALSEIVDSAGIIESEKSEAPDPSPKNIWESFYDKFTDEEASTFYYSLEKVNLEPDKAIIEQGKLNDKLYFVNQGQLKHICLQDDRELFLRNISPGEIVGHDTFFPITTCTTSVITVVPTQLSFITRDAFFEMDKIFPGLEGKLNNLCNQLEKESPVNILKKIMVERRRYGRVKSSGKVMTRIIDVNGQPQSGLFTGRLEDISQGGVSYLIKCSKKETARLLLGRAATAKLIISGDESQGIEKTSEGQIVCLQNQLLDDYMIHFKFTKPFEVEEYSKLYPFLSRRFGEG